MHLLTEKELTLAALHQLWAEHTAIELTDSLWTKVKACRDFLEQKVAASEDSFYGINTGFGSLCDVKIGKEALSELQHNLVRSHAFGTGDLVPQELARLMLLLKIQNLAQGFSGVRPILLQRLIDSYNADLIPVIYQLGSLGASGDLAPLAHLSLPILGEGEVYFKGERMPSTQALEKLGWQPLALEMKEGLALLNGTQFSLAYGIYSYWKAEKLSLWADSIAAISIDGFGGLLSPFDERLHLIRPHNGQLQTAKNIRTLLADSPLMKAEKEVVQDPYSFRCVPQVHGASKDALEYAKKVLTTELNSVTDNPNIFPETDAILSGGNFHAQPLALTLDFMAMALSELGSISERRLYQLIGGKRGLPAFLTPNSGLHSGLMIGQYTAASIASQNKQLCTPASVDSLVSCNGQEDHVSMAANAGTKLYRLVHNLERLLAIELMAAMQSLEFRTLTSSAAIENCRQAFRQVVPAIEGDRVFAQDLAKAIDFIAEKDSPLAQLTNN
ncbi:histidine ammonia-lyase [Saprospira grandis]|uniref:Histidine ammonia-lyase n=1 Tax=Saprospira grandis (strain Lewin) TaxID=984262 RepID=H6L6I9_SAPGL|nr:histidine ammonia-lyase [Saprospira grandis]AFC24131.1 histidine ammonia-lyase [Saprospira grandis str. Lewin]